MDFKTCMENRHNFLMEGALGERLKREYGLNFDEHVAMATLIYDSNGRFALKSLWQEYMNIAIKHKLPFMATTPTRRANKERVKQAGFNSSIIIDNVNFLRKIQQESDLEMYIGGLMGCRGDAYTGENALSEKDARVFHKWQADLFCTSGADFLYAGIMPTLPEATGMAQAMSETGLRLHIRSR